MTISTRLMSKMDQKLSKYRLLGETWERERTCRLVREPADGPRECIHHLPERQKLWQEEVREVRKIFINA